MTGKLRANYQTVLDGIDTDDSNFAKIHENNKKSIVGRHFFLHLRNRYSSAMSSCSANQLSSLHLFKFCRAIGLCTHEPNGHRSTLLWMVLVVNSSLLVLANGSLIAHMAQRAGAFWTIVSALKISYFLVFVVCHAVQMTARTRDFECLFSTPFIVGRSNGSPTLVFYAQTALSVGGALHRFLLADDCLEGFLHINFYAMEFCIQLVLLQFSTAVHSLCTEFTALRLAKPKREFLISFHSELLDKAKRINNMYQVQSLIFTIYCWFDCGLILWVWAANSIQKGPLLKFILIGTVKGLGNAFGIVFCCHVCETTARSAEKFNRELFEEIMAYETIEGHEVALTYFKFMPTIKFKACGFFTLGYPLLASMLSTTVTYLVIMIQSGIKTFD